MQFQATWHIIAGNKCQSLVLDIYLNLLLHINTMSLSIVMKQEIQWNLVIKRSDITKPSYNKVILLVPALYISLIFYPDITR